MRFGVAPSLPSSPVPRHNKQRGRSTYGLSPYDSSDEDDIPAPPDDTSQCSSDSLFYNSESEIPPRSQNLNKSKRSLQEQKAIDEIVLGFRRRGEYQEPYKEWVKATRNTALRTATKRYESNPASITATRQRESQLREMRLKESHHRQYEEVTAILEQMSIRRKREEAKLLSDYKERERLMWQRVEGVIRDEEDKLRRRLEAEAIARHEEQERIQREEQRKKAEEERKEKEEKERALMEELSRLKKEKEAEEERKRAEDEAQKMAKVDQGRKDAGFGTAHDDWEYARRSLQLVKRDCVPAVKADPNLRSIWSKGRRGIVPKIGQLTNSQSEVQRITTAILQIIVVQPPHPENLYISLLSSLAKAILMQAETEVSARAVTALPLAQVTIGLLTRLESFPHVLFARMVQRTGGWAVPIPLGKPANMSEVEYKKLRGYRTEREEQKDFEIRVTGIMTLYFAILTADVPQPLPPPWALPRYWTYIARLMSTPILLRSDVATQIIAAYMDIGGARGKRAWGAQFVKVLRLLHKSVQETPDSESETANGDRKQVGGEGSGGKAGRVKVLLEIEKVMAS